MTVPLQVTERIVLTLWVGGLWAIGYLAAPVVFATVDERGLAGTVAGEMFSAMSFVGIACALLLLAGAAYRARGQWLGQWRVWTLIAMLLITLAGEFVLRPLMADLRAGGLVEGTPQAVRFARLHGLAAVLFLATSVLGLSLVIAGPGADEAQ